MKYNELNTKQLSIREDIWKKVLNEYCPADEVGNRPCDIGCYCDKCHYNQVLKRKTLQLYKDNGVITDEELTYLEDKKLKDLYIKSSTQGGSFMKSLCDAIGKADLENTEKLYLGFPDLVNGYWLYSKGERFK